MQLLPTLAVAAATAAAALVLAEQEVHLRMHLTEHKFYVTPIGQQCAFNNCVDPSVYPCANGVCVRLNYTYGICSDDSKDMSADVDYDDPKLLCPYPNPYNSKLGSLGDEEDDDTDDA
ncbi:hypothetical protein PHYSODRAFT_354683 [Phytophthora sojae]|uniref:Uncharacterized protein n=1 Tax=Phytophthora sojae (strain P6497) TaxID=1094619 RepID=G4ZHP7_PHYSP|nr:hypothetical protein PHYSODRAFT_354683 [Phytophthora sojae]EGZ18702.1 hypothetical protein PHYSODRAFT_354683 [Phytophthora sojae]|eukprot:XP_009527760.1 hypothetical protein PHYSODRAFT_354683 [Phytophthora sojae]